MRSQHVTRRMPSTSFSALTRLSRALQQEAVAGALLLAATLIALVWANSPASEAYDSVRSTTFGPSALHLHLSIEAWAADGLLAMFFFVVGLELKREFVLGDLRSPRTALVPIAAAAGGVIVPALTYLAVTAVADQGGMRGWAIPTATDIAFALAVIAVVGRGLPPALRTFLLTLAVVDDLLAITIIAVVYTDDLNLVLLALSLVPLVAFAAFTHRQVTSWWLLIPLALTTWALVHASGIHATVAGVLLGLVVPADLTTRFEHAWKPWSVGLAVPVFALLAAGVEIGGVNGFTDALRDPIAIGIVAGLVLGKPLGITLTAWLVTRVTGAQLDPSLRWADVIAASTVAGIGFTVSLLIGDLAFGLGTTTDDHVKLAVLTGSLAAAVAGGVLVRRSAHRR
jgi:NhaA family Na+:H+ antiporter